jgi:DHA1 family bicyclomycin/chloramphenicol resistance-like MFS transporter
MQQKFTSNRVDSPAHFPIHFREFVALVAAMMALNALSIDPMLPALPAIGKALSVHNPNDRQWIITAYFIGMGLGSLIYGPLSDRYGRRPVLCVTLTLFTIATMMCALAPSFPLLLAGRAAAGFFAAASRVIAVSVVRDRFHGDRMAGIMSLIFMVFMIVPVLAPSFGQLILTVAPWRGIFWVLTGVGLLVLLWIVIRLPETLKPENRMEVNVRDLASTLKRIVTHRTSIGYMVASGVITGGLVAFITSVQQIFFDVYHAQTVFPLAFAGMAMFMALGGLTNSRLVVRIGARRLSHGALMAMILISAVRAFIGWAGLDSMPAFIVTQALTMFCFALTGSNFSAISMEPFARGAGLASSFQACLTTILSAVLGAAVGAQFNGTTLPLALGFLVFGLIALLIVSWAEHGKLFTRPKRGADRPNPSEMVH